MKPLIYFSYGMTKCGSTLGFELVRTALEFCGYQQSKLPKSLVDQNKKINYIQQIDSTQKQILLDEIIAIGHPIAIKTHGKPTPQIKKLIAEGYAIGHAIYRDPRDMALSLLDHGRKARLKGEQAFSKIETLDDALNNIRDQINNLRAWLSLPKIQPLYFDDIAFDTEKCCAQMMQQLEIGEFEKPQKFVALVMKRLGLMRPSSHPHDLSSQIVDHVFKHRFTQFNKGIRDRYRTEMSPEDSKRIEEEFAPLFAKLIYSRPNVSNSNLPCLSPDDSLRIKH